MAIGDVVMAWGGLRCKAEQMHGELLSGSPPGELTWGAKVQGEIGAQELVHGPVAEETDEDAAAMARPLVRSPLG